MNKIVLSIQGLFERISHSWSGLSDRERRLVSLLGLALVLTVVALGITSFRKGLAAREAIVEQKSASLERVVELSSGYRDAQAARSRVESRLKGSPIRLFSYLEDIAKKQAVAIGDMQDRGTETTDGLVKSTVEVSFARTELKPFVRFLNEIEKNPRLVKVEKLRIRHRNDDPQLLDINLTVSTYHLSES